MAPLSILAVTRLTIGGPAAVDRARRAARGLAVSLGFHVADAECIALATGELAANLLRYAEMGAIVLSSVERSGSKGVGVASHDGGPGIADLPRALEDGFSTGGGLGSGLPGVRRLMDEFTISTGTTGTTIVTYKWLTRP